MAAPALTLKPIDADAERDRLAAELVALGEATADGRFHRAAGILRGEPGGRPATDDGVLLAEMAGLLREGLARGVRDAARMVASAHTESVFLDSTTRRLERKFKAVGQKYFHPRAARVCRT